MPTSNGKSNKQAINEFASKVLGGGDAGLVDRYIDPGFVDHQPWPGHTPDVAGFRAGLAEFHQAFPDLRVQVDRLVEEGDMVAGLFTLSGTHLGSFMGAPGSGKTFEVSALDLVRMREGRMVEHWGFLDTEAMTRQLGLAPG